MTAPCEQTEAAAEDTEAALLVEPAVAQAPTWRRARLALAASAAFAALAAGGGALAARRLGLPRRATAAAASGSAGARIVRLEEDCGYQGITQAICEEWGCIYDETAAVWCTHPGSGGDGGGGDGGGDVEMECAEEGAMGDGGDCGYQGITEDECVNLGCCYNEQNPYNWCFPKSPVGMFSGGGGGGGGGGDGASLFCFVVACSDEEHAVLGLQDESHAGIFACNEFKVIDGQGSAKGGGLTSSWTNVDTFIAAWRDVDGDGRWRNHDWIVKADPDTVWVPQRLRDWLGGQGDPGNGAFVSNCMGVDNGFYGALEVISKGGVDTYLREMDNCLGELQGKEGMGEDLFAQWCMQSKGVDSWFNGDLICNTDCGCDPRPCDTGRIAYHPFKGTEDHGYCLSQLR